MPLRSSASKASVCPGRCAEAMIRPSILRAISTSRLRVSTAASSMEDAAVERRNLEVLIARKMDGLIIASAQRPGQTEAFEALDRSGIAYVLVDRMLAGVNANYVGVRDQDLGIMATEHLISQGARRIAHIRGPSVSTGTARLRGYRKSLERHGVKYRPEYVVPGQSGDSGGDDAMQQLLNAGPRPDGVFGYPDPAAPGAIT